MTIRILNDDTTITSHTIRDKVCDKNKIEFISSSSKEINALNLIGNYQTNNKTILFDNTNKILSQTMDKLDLVRFEKQRFSMMFFTSGTTGNPIGALKTKQNLEDEVRVFSKLIEKYKIKQVIVTVPFIHIYGTLVGLLYPLLNDIDIVLKEHFLPNDLLNCIEDNSLIVTTPLYIKALNNISNSMDLNSSLFVSSTAPLDSKSAKQFCGKFNTNIIQLFGSTETSGIAYKYNDEELWTPLDKVKISVNEENELKVNSPFISNVLYENNFINIVDGFQTFDYIEQYQDKFKLIGRSSKILKVAGKRYSTVQIEQVLEDTIGISKALVFIDENEDSLKGEILDITLEATIDFTSKQIISILKTNLSNLKFLIRLKLVDKIQTNQIGKKLIIK